MEEVIDELEKSLIVLKNKEVDLLLGFQSYPTENCDNHILRFSKVSSIAQNSQKFQIGFADHANPNNQMKFAIACTAVGAGYEVIEKHLTLGKIMNSRTTNLLLIQMSLKNLFI